MTNRASEGGCLCGAVRYRFTGAPRVNALCHCRSCQRASGAPSVAWTVVASSDFSFASGMPALFRSSPGVMRTFCASCGTPLTYQRETETQTVDVTTASLDSPNDFAPACEIWLSHKVSWERSNEAIPQYAGTSREGTPAPSESN